MPTILTIGTNSYQALTDAAAYFAQLLDTAVWDAAASTQQEKALVTAWQAIESLPRWNGVPYVSTQATAWPRSYVFDDNGNAYATGAGTIVAHYPAPLRAAQCEEALARLKQLTNTVADYAAFDRRNGIIERQSSEGARVKYAEMLTGLYGGYLMSERAYQLLRPLLASGFGGVQAATPHAADLRYINGRYRGEGDGL